MPINNEIIHNERTLYVYLGYRFLLGIVLFLTFLLTTNDNILGKYSAELFQWTCIFYILLCFGSLFVFQPKRLIHSVYRVTFLLISDVLALLALIHASGGIDSGLAYLLMTSAAIAGIFVTGKMAVAIAAFISLFMMGETAYLTLGTNKFTSDIFASGTLGILIFSTSLMFHYLSEKIRKTTKEAEKQARHVKNLQRIAQEIIERMQTGIIVINDKDNIEQVNEAALQMLDLPKRNTYYGENIDQLSNLKNVLDDWRKHPIIGIPRLHKLRASQEVRINFATLESHGTSQVILYIEDNRAITQQAQHLKLASLGRLTASIAHEIRNPLGAISHASQLLNESEELPETDKRLLNIILSHSDRVNQIIENTLSLSRRKEANPELLNLVLWVRNFTKELNIANNYQIEIDQIHLHTKIFAKIDPTHLCQILTNLIDNAARYSKERILEPKVTIRIGVSKNTDKAFLNVIDYGKGIDKANQEEIFEPFFTTDNKGTGLGLFISKELCEINQASLHYSQTQENLSCFRIDFSHYQRII